MENKEASKNDPIIKIIEFGIELWIRKQCKSIGNLKLEIFGSTIELIRGRLSEVKLIANKVNFQDLNLYYVNLRSDPLKFNINLSRRDQRFVFRKRFGIKADVHITTENLNQLLNTERWKWIGDWLANKLIKADKLKSMKINENSIKLAGVKSDETKVLTDEFFLKSSSGTLMFHNKNKTITSLLPMDPNINIYNALIKDNKIFVSIHSEINPK